MLQTKSGERLAEKSACRILVCGLLLCWSFSVALHVPSFFRTSFSGDEAVYIELSKAMSWKLSNYTTSNNTAISKWPNTIYSAPVFIHGPTLPLLLKLGDSNISSARIAFLTFNTTIGLFILLIAVLSRRLGIQPIFVVAGVLLFAISPLIVFSTTRLHTDALAGILGACSIISQIESLERRSKMWALAAGLFLVAALNSRYSALLFLPISFSLHAHHILRIRRDEGHPKLWQTHSAEVKSGLIILLIVATAGLQHFYRLAAEYGSILPWHFMANDIDSQWHKFLETRSRTSNVRNLFLLLPILALLFLRPTLTATLGSFTKRKWEGTILLCFVFLIVCMVVFSYEEMRFFALAMPTFYCLLPWILRASFARLPVATIGLWCISFFLMSIASYREVVVRPDQVFGIVPTLYELIPPLARFW